MRTSAAATRDAVAAVLAEHEAAEPDDLGPSPASRETVTSRACPEGGRYRLELVACGRECSTCRRGPAHGPYWYWYGRQGGRLTSRYVGKRLPGEREGADDGEPASPQPARA